MPGTVGIHFARYDDCHPIKFFLPCITAGNQQTLYLGWDFTYSVEQYWHLYWQDPSLPLSDLPNSNCLSRYNWFLLVSIHICYRHLSTFWFYNLLSQSDQPQSYHWSTNCRAPISLCPQHFPSLPLLIAVYLNKKWCW